MKATVLPRAWKQTFSWIRYTKSPQRNRLWGYFKQFMENRIKTFLCTKYFETPLSFCNAHLPMNLSKTFYTHGFQLFLQQNYLLTLFPKNVLKYPSMGKSSLKWILLLWSNIPTHATLSSNKLSLQYPFQTVKLLVKHENINANNNMNKNIKNTKQ